MPRVLLLFPTRTYRAEAFLAAARHLNLEVTVASEEESSLASLNPAGLLTLDFDDPDGAARAVAAFARNHPIQAVVPVDERTVAVAAAVAAALSLRHNSVAAATAAADKHRMRQRLQAAGVPAPGYRLCEIHDDPWELAGRIDTPCVLKPLILSGSRGVIRADTEGEFVAAFRRIGAILRTPEVAGRGPAARRILIEDFVPGREVALEGLLSGGVLQVLALFDKPDPLDGPFFEETIYLTPSRLDVGLQSDIARCAALAARALGLTEGPVHAELRVGGDRPSVIEIAARSIGGRCSRVLRFQDGMSLEEVILRQALGEEIQPRREPRAAGVMMIPIPAAGILREVCGMREAAEVPGVEELMITAHPGQRLVPLPEGSQYLGFIFARRETAEEVEASLRAAHARLEFAIESVHAEVAQPA
ncbi:MAG: ATP-grasp domain-containing protein [Acidobacteria bacterium]|nr:ATP-grasp domain-containing protein [Acidobacteriota bacterium]